MLFKQRLNTVLMDILITANKFRPLRQKVVCFLKKGSMLFGKRSEPPFFTLLYRNTVCCSIVRMNRPQYLPPISGYPNTNLSFS